MSGLYIAAFKVPRIVPGTQQTFDKCLGNKRKEGREGGRETGREEDRKRGKKEKSEKEEVSRGGREGRRKVGEGRRVQGEQRERRGNSSTSLKGEENKDKFWKVKVTMRDHHN